MSNHVVSSSHFAFTGSITLSPNQAVKLVQAFFAPSIIPVYQLISSPSPAFGRPASPSVNLFLAAASSISSAAILSASCWFGVPAVPPPPPPPEDRSAISLFAERICSS